MFDQSTIAELIAQAKLRVRKSTSDVLDNDIGQLVETALTDIKRIGVQDKYLLFENIDPLIRETVLTFVNANYGNNPDRENLMNSYDMFLTRIKGGRYFE